MDCSPELEGQSQPDFIPCHGAILPPGPSDFKLDDYLHSVLGLELHLSATISPESLEHRVDALFPAEQEKADDSSSPPYAWPVVLSLYRFPGASKDDMCSSIGWIADALSISLYSGLFGSVFLDQAKSLKMKNPFESGQSIFPCLVDSPVFKLMIQSIYKGPSSQRIYDWVQSQYFTPSVVEQDKKFIDHINSTIGGGVKVEESMIVKLITHLSHEESSIIAGNVISFSSVPCGIMGTVFLDKIIKLAQGSCLVRAKIRRHMLTGVDTGVSVDSLRKRMSKQFSGGLNSISAMVARGALTTVIPIDGYHGLKGSACTLMYSSSNSEVDGQYSSLADEWAIHWIEFVDRLIEFENLDCSAEENDNHHSLYPIYVSMILLTLTLMNSQPSSASGNLSLVGDRFQTENDKAVWLDSFFGACESVQQHPAIFPDNSGTIGALWRLLAITAGYRGLVPSASPHVSKLDLFSDHDSIVSTYSILIGSSYLPSCKDVNPTASSAVGAVLWTLTVKQALMEANGHLKKLIPTLISEFNLLKSLPQYDRILDDECAQLESGKKKARKALLSFEEEAGLFLQYVMLSSDNGVALPQIHNHYSHKLCPAVGELRTQLNATPCHVDVTAVLPIVLSVASAIWDMQAHNGFCLGVDSEGADQVLDHVMFIMKKIITEEAVEELLILTLSNHRQVLQQYHVHLDRFWVGLRVWILFHCPSFAQTPGHAVTDSLLVEVYLLLTKILTHPTHSWITNQAGRFDDHRSQVYQEIIGSCRSLLKSILILDVDRQNVMSSTLEIVADSLLTCVQHVEEFVSDPCVAPSRIGLLGLLSSDPTCVDSCFLISNEILRWIEEIPTLELLWERATEYTCVSTFLNSSESSIIFIRNHRELTKRYFDAVDLYTTKLMCTANSLSTPAGLRLRVMLTKILLDDTSAGGANLLLSSGLDISLGDDKAISTPLGVYPSPSIPSLAIEPLLQISIMAMLDITGFDRWKDLMSGVKREVETPSSIRLVRLLNEFVELDCVSHYEFRPYTLSLPVWNFSHSKLLPDVTVSESLWAEHLKRTRDRLRITVSSEEFLSMLIREFVSLVVNRLRPLVEEETISHGFVRMESSFDSSTKVEVTQIPKYLIGGWMRGEDRSMPPQNKRARNIAFASVRVSELLRQLTWSIELLSMMSKYFTKRVSSSLKHDDGILHQLRVNLDVLVLLAYKVSANLWCESSCQSSESIDLVQVIIDEPNTSGVGQLENMYPNLVHSVQSLLIAARKLIITLGSIGKQ
eukprot:GHVH01007759.1.p1 GENE.GHVH01007759.1~~GHVH01007759.1.p1  ORF type:complete len:1262 (+),score=150.95 GHVH01007759.1:2161-5946(+)